MIEYKIYQRWFVKLKRKVVAKMREIEQSWKYGKEVVGEVDILRKFSFDRFQRKRRLNGVEVLVFSFFIREVEDGILEVWQEGEIEFGQYLVLGLINSFVFGEVIINGEVVLENGEDGEYGLLTYICEVMELGFQRVFKKEFGVKKKKKDEDFK